MTEAHVLRALLRQSLGAFGEKTFNTLEPGTTFKPSWVHDHLGWAISRILSGERRRLIINVPPRSGKSNLTSVSLPLYVLGHDPTRRIICVSHTEDLARKFSIDRRTVAQSAWYQKTFPAMRLASKRPRDLELVTTQRGSCRAAGVGGSILGLGADLIIIDDPMKATDALSKAERRRVAEFYDNTLVTRLNDKQTGAIILIMQRLHEEDLVGHVLERDDWDVVALPAIAIEDTTHQLSQDPNDLHTRHKGEVLHPEREPRHVLEQIRRAQGSLTFEAQYQQTPAPAGGNIIQRKWLRYYEENDEELEFELIVTSWDTASTLGENSDWSVGTVWGSIGFDFYLLDLVREQVEAPALRRIIEQLSLQWRADATVIEDTELGRAMTQDLRQTGRIRPILNRPKFDKEARLVAQATRFETGQVYLPTKAPWLATYESELLAFPNGRHDDQVDSTSQALLWLTARMAARQPMKRRNPIRRNIERA